MQLYAFDSNNCLIFSSSAQKQKNYFCPECKNVVRLRGGIQRQNHFYHLEIVRECRQNGKSLQHLATQLLFIQRLPKGECFLEQAFPAVGRIADVVWESQKIVFEIQCSFITAAEVEARNRDYSSQGYQVVWILHDMRYNKSRLTAMELYLQGRPHYFTNMQSSGKGIVYDQFSIIRGTLRERRLQPLPIDLAALKILDSAALESLPLYTVKQRHRSWHQYFAGDLTDSVIHGLFNAEIADDYWLQALDLERAAISEKDNKILFYIKKWFNLYLFRPYFLILQILLERASK